MISLLYISFLGALLARLDGNGFKEIPELAVALLRASFFVAACLPFAHVWALPAFAGALGIQTGHGQYFPKLSIEAVETERLDFIVSLIFGADPRTNAIYAPYRELSEYQLRTHQPEVYDAILRDIRAYGRLKYRCMFGMFVTGLAVGLPAALIAVIFGQFWIAAALALTGPIKAIVYPLCWELFKNTAPAEWAFGGLSTAVAMAAYLGSAA